MCVSPLRKISFFDVVPKGASHADMPVRQQVIWATFRCIKFKSPLRDNHDSRRHVPRPLTECHRCKWVGLVRVRRQTTAVRTANSHTAHVQYVLEDEESGAEVTNMSYTRTRTEKHMQYHG